MKRAPHFFDSVLFRILRVVFVLAVALVLAAVLIKAGPKPQRQMPEQALPSVAVVAVFPEKQPLLVEAFGTLKPRRSVRIIAEVGGRIQKIHPQFKVGAAVEKGSLLMGLDPRTYDLDHRSAKVRLEEARINIKNLEQETRNLRGDIELAKSSLAVAQRELGRVKALTSKSFASRNRLDQSEQQLLAAQIKLHTLENHLRLMPTLMAGKKAAMTAAVVAADRAALNLSKTEIKADFNGWVLEKNVELGELVNPGQSLGRIYERRALDLDVAIPLEQLPWLGQGVLAEDLKAWVRPETGNGGMDKRFPARVVRMGAEVDATTRTLDLTLELLPGEETGLLKPGSFVHCTIQGPRVETVFVLPRHLIRSGGRVFVHDQGKLRIQSVEILRTQGDQALIRKGLKAGDQVITSPLPGAVDGMALALGAAEPAQEETE